MRTYGIISRINHWVAALCFLGMLAVGFFMTYVELPRDVKFPLLTLHKAFGVLLLVFAFWRVGYRIWFGFAPPLGTGPHWEEMLAKLVHVVLLCCVVAMPLSGLVMALFVGQPTDVFGLFSIPPIDKTPAISGLARAVHKWTAYCISAALVLHIAGAVKHHVIDKDQTVRRMLRG